MRGSFIGPVVDDVTDSADSSLFERAPYALWEVDLSDLVPWMEERRKEGVEDLLKYFARDPRASQRAAAQVVVKSANAMGRQMAGVPTVHLMLGKLDVLIGHETKEVFARLLAAVYRGERDIQIDGRARDVPGAPFDVLVTLKLPEGTSKWDSVIIGFVEIGRRSE